MNNLCNRTGLLSNDTPCLKQIDEVVGRRRRSCGGLSYVFAAGKVGCILIVDETEDSSLGE
ncbi:hypothetical protein M514_28322 [Trichuris suis]|uniref:Uncharacterized protein n=1 Tax=Trichuris suis TaxID=68888 RepID=A0A085MQK4_9BILA|nr:hypothetical protein M514_28322 [Trichuris suis]